MSQRISWIEGGDAERVNALRLGEYAGTRGFAVQPPGILWNRSDDQATILGAWDGDELVSTMRVELIADPALVEAKLECPWDFALPLALPVVILGKLATRKPYRAGGLNTALRWWALTFAREWGAGLVLGTFVKGSPRQAAMAEMGYEFFEHAHGWTSPHYKSTDPVLVCALALEAHGDLALDVCARQAAGALAAWPWAGPRPARRLVEVVS